MEGKNLLPRPPRFEPGVWTLAVVIFLNAMAFSISLPFMALYLHQERGIPMTLVGLIILGGGLLSAATQIVGGALSDRFGRRPLLLWAVSGSILLYAAMAILIGASAPVLVIAAVYAGVRAALMMPRAGVSAMIVDLTPRERLAEANAMVRVGQNVGWAAGPALGGYLALSLSYGWLFGIGALITGLTFLVIFLKVKESFNGRPAEVGGRAVLVAAGDRRFLQFTLLCVLVTVAMGQMSSTLSVYTVDRAGFATSQYGLLLTINGLMVVAFQYPLARLAGRFSAALVLVVGSLLYALGYLSMAWVGSFALAVAAMVVVTMGEMAFSPTSFAVAGDLSPPESRGRYMGFFGLSETIGLSLGPLVGGVLLDVFPTEPLGVWGTLALIAAFAALGFHLWGRTRPANG